MNSPENTQPDIYSWFKQYCQPALSMGQRLAFVIAGNKQWAQSLVYSFPDAKRREKKLIVSPVINNALLPEKATMQLGNEYDEVIFDAHQGFDADAFGAISGTLRGSGIFILLVPEITTWQEYNNSHFLQRIISLSRKHQSVLFIEQGKNLSECEQLPLEKITQQIPGKPYLTQDQKDVVENILEVIKQEKNIPIVITSDRGRGKSSSLGIAAAQLLQQGLKNIIVTAPRLSTSRPLFEHAKNILPEAIVEKGRLDYTTGNITYWACDALIEQQPDADMVIVDEAAAIPLTMLQKLLERYNSVVFSSTIHGYEGTGRGFALKFSKMLDSYNPGWLSLTMRTPVRWPVGDPVEHWVDHLLCLDAELSDIPVEIPVEQCEVTQLKQSELANDENKLSSLFSLLVYAHYRTKPSDLQYLLDEKNIRIYSLEYQNKIIAALVVNVEGGFAHELSSAIYRGERRPAGHLLAQTLTFHAGCEQAATLEYARIMRIAVHPEVQGKGLGSYFLQEVVKQEKQHRVDILGTSFAASIELLRFWRRTGFNLVRMGFTRDHVSGMHSAVMVMPFSRQGQLVFDDVSERFIGGLQNWLSEPLQDLPLDMKSYLASLQQPYNTELTARDWQDIESFVATHRGYEACMAAIHKLLANYPGCLDELEDKNKKLLQTRVVERKSWAETVAICNLSGKNQAIQQLKLATGILLKKLK